MTESLEWNYDMSTVPQGEPVLVWLEEPLSPTNAHFTSALFLSNVTIIGGRFSFDAPKPLAWARVNKPKGLT